MAKIFHAIPLSPEPQSLGITLAGQEYRLTVRWAETVEGGWMLDIQKPENAGPIIMGLPLVTGCDLLEPFGYMEFGGELWLDSFLPATPDNLGTEAELVFVTEGAE